MNLPGTAAILSGPAGLCGNSLVQLPLEQKYLLPSRWQECSQKCPRCVQQARFSLDKKSDLHIYSSMDTVACASG